MSEIEFNPLSGKFDLVGPSSGSSFDSDNILMGPTDCLFAVVNVPLSVLYDDNGNILVGGG